MKLDRKLDVGMRVEATDGPVGEVVDVVVDPVKWRLTHLVVQSEPHHHDRAHLIPIEAVTEGGGPVVLSWSTKQVSQAPLVQVTDFIPVERNHPVPGDWEPDDSPTLAWPFYPSGGMVLDSGVAIGYGHGYGYGFGFGEPDSGYTGDWPRMVTTTYDHVPNGTIEIRRASEVVSSDDHVVGHVDGFVVNPSGDITHLVLDHGHLWGHREITIPLTDVSSANSDRVSLTVTREAIGEYPSMPFQRHEVAS